MVAGREAAGPGTKLWIRAADGGRPGSDGVTASGGVCWTPAHKDSSSRQNGWELLREQYKNVMKPDGPRLFVFNVCRQCIRTVPVLPRDEIDRDDVDSGHALARVGRRSAAFR